MEKELMKVLKAREQRWEMRRAIVKNTNSCLITITMCVPVAFRTDEEFCMIFLELSLEFYKFLISSGYDARFEGCIRNDDGPAFFISTKNDSKQIKKICAEAEDTILGGRMLDIDVLDSDGIPVGRSDIGLPQRKCFICDNPASVCVSRKIHSPDEISKYVLQLKDKIRRNKSRYI